MLYKWMLYRYKCRFCGWMKQRSTSTAPVLRIAWSLYMYTCMLKYTYVSTCVCGLSICIHVYRYTCMSVYVYTCIPVYMYTCILSYMYVSICVCGLSICIHVYENTCISVYVYLVSLYVYMYTQIHVYQYLSVEVYVSRLMHV